MQSSRWKIAAGLLGVHEHAVAEAEEDSGDAQHERGRGHGRRYDEHCLAYRREHHALDEDDAAEEVDNEHGHDHEHICKPGTMAS